MTYPKVCFAIVLAMLAVGVNAQDAPVSEAKIQQLIGQLADDDFNVRERATSELWAIGEPAEAALRKVVDDARDYEAVWRAKTILSRFDLGIYPDTPPAVRELLERYRDGDDDARRGIIRMLLRQGMPGVSAVGRLLERTDDEDLRTYIRAQFVEQATAVAPVLIARGEIEQAGQILKQAAASENLEAIAAFAGYERVRGTLDDTLKSLTGDSVQVALQRAALLRAAGRTADALDAIKSPTFNSLTGADAIRAMRIALLQDTADWAALADLYDKSPITDSPVQSLGYRLAFNRLAGRTDKADAAAAELLALGKADRDTAWPVAEALFVNDRIDDAVAVLEAASHHSQLAAIHRHRHDYTAALKAIEAAATADVPEEEEYDDRRFALRMEAVSLRAELGDKDAARKAVTAVMDEAIDAARLNQHLEAIRIARVAGLDDLALRHAANALAVADNDWMQLRIVMLVFWPNSDEATLWWAVLQQAMPDESTDKRLARVEEAVRETDADKLRPMITLALDQATPGPGSAPAPGSEASARAGRVIEIYPLLHAVCLARGLEAEADDVLKAWRRDQPDNPAQLEASARHATEARRWDDAAELWKRLAAASPGQALPIAMRAHCDIQAGRTTVGQIVMQQAMMLAAVNNAQALTLAAGLADFELHDEAAKVHDLLLATAQPGSWHQNRALDALAEAAAEAGDFDRAVQLSERSRLFVLDPSVGYSQSAGALHTSARIASLRAQAALKRGDHEAMHRWLDRALAASPVDIELVIQWAPRLEAFGQHDRARAIFKAQVDRLRDVVTTWPDAGNELNTLAWLCVRRRALLDEAFAWSAHSVKVAPRQAAYIDTLAEIHFQQGRTDQALKLIKRCLELEPTYDYFHRQLERFKAGDPTTEPEE